MNAVEIADAVADLFQQAFDRDEFPFAFLEAFGNKETTIRRLRKGDSNTSDVQGGVLQKNNIHLAVCSPGEVDATLAALRASPKTIQNKVKFVLATDGDWLEAEDLRTGEVIATPYVETAVHFGFFLELAGITAVREIKDNPIDIRATGRLNKLYVELLRENPEWATETKRPDMNHFMARLIFCFFAEDTHIFHGDGLFTQTIAQMTQGDGSNVHQVVETLFRAMNLDLDARKAADLPLWADAFPYVNGGLFSGSLDVPRFTRIARSYLLRAGELRWREINPDIFGSMIQAVADDEERGALGMHYTSVPNILKVLNPLFLDDLRAQLEEAGESPVKLLNLRRRMARIRVFDPACGSGNFLVIAYKEMRRVEAEVNRRRGEIERASDIPLTNFRGIEIRDFAAEIARLALVIAEYQCDVVYRGEKLALAEFLPLNRENWIVRGNALRLDWASICPPRGTAVRHNAMDLFSSPLEQSEIAFDNEGGETYLCGNPPYRGSTWQTAEQKDELRSVLNNRCPVVGLLDYVTGWFVKAADYAATAHAAAAFVATNSICQGQSVPGLWPVIYDAGLDILFAHTSFKWANLASHNAGVTVVIVGIGAANTTRPRRLFVPDERGGALAREGQSITPYLTLGDRIIVRKSNSPIGGLSPMDFGNEADDGGHLTMSAEDVNGLNMTAEQKQRFLRRFWGSSEFISGVSRYCLWIDDADKEAAMSIPSIRERIDAVRRTRLKSPNAYANKMAARPHQFKTPRSPVRSVIVTPRVSSENRPYLPVGLMNAESIIGDRNFAIYDAPLWNMAIIASRLHWIWVGTVCVRLEMRFSYSNTLGWNTFPVPPLTEGQKTELSECAERILLSRETHFPATIAELYDPDAMPDDLRRAHERNDETLERIYIGRRFKNDTERLEKLFEMYTAMTAVGPAAQKTRKAAIGGRKA